MGKSLAGQRIVVTGATGGIGSALCAELADAGAVLAMTSTSSSKLAELASTVGGFYQAADITDERAVSAFFTAAGAELSGVDALVNLAGVSAPGPVADMSIEQYERIIGSNVTGTFLSCKHFIPLADSNSGAIIVNVGSMAGHRANATAPLYCTAKAAVNMFSEALALQLKGSNIRVTSVNPGGVDTPFWGTRQVDRARMLSAADVVDVIVFVLSRPSHVDIKDIAFESAGITRETA